MTAMIPAEVLRERLIERKKMWRDECMYDFADGVADAIDFLDALVAESWEEVEADVDKNAIKAARDALVAETAREQVMCPDLPGGITCPAYDEPQPRAGVGAMCCSLHPGAPSLRTNGCAPVGHPCPVILNPQEPRERGSHG
jgi:hypothetical protein